MVNLRLFNLAQGVVSLLRSSRAWGWRNHCWSRETIQENRQGLKESKKQFKEAQRLAEKREKEAQELIALRREFELKQEELEAFQEENFSILEIDQDIQNISLKNNS